MSVYIIPKSRRLFNLIYWLGAQIVIASVSYLLYDKYIVQRTDRRIRPASANMRTHKFAYVQKTAQKWSSL